MQQKEEVLRQNTGGERRPTMLLTGASRGIGHATVKLFDEHNWRVLTVSRAAFSEACPWGSGPEDHIQADLSEPDGVQTLVAEVRRRLGGAGLDALVNNAGISPKMPDGSRRGVRETDHEAWISVFNVNLFSAALLARELSPDLQQASGAIVNVTSIAGTRVHPFAGTAYACSKAALAALTREQAFDLGRLGVRVNAVSPGEIGTSILSSETEDRIEQIVPMQRLGDAMEVARMIVFLCSSGASFVNGADIPVNGGQHV